MTLLWFASDVHSQRAADAFTSHCVISLLTVCVLVFMCCSFVAFVEIFWCFFVNFRPNSSLVAWRGRGGGAGGGLRTVQYPRAAYNPIFENRNFLYQTVRWNTTVLGCWNSCRIRHIKNRTHLFNVIATYVISKQSYCQVGSGLPLFFLWHWSHGRTLRTLQALNVILRKLVERQWLIFGISSESKPV